MFPALWGFYFVAMAFLAAPAQAAWEIPLEAGDALTVKGWSARVTYQSAPEAKGLTVSGGEASSAWSWRRDDGRVWIEQTLPSSKQELREKAGAAREQVALTIRGPSIPSEFYLNEGLVQIVQSRQPARVTMKQGRAVAVKTAAPLRISMQNGQVEVVEHQGPLDLDVYEGAVVLKKLEGDVRAELFGPDLTVEGGRGQMRLASREATIRLNQWKGGLRFDQDKGTMVLSAFEGRVDGESAEGSLQFAILPSTEVHLKTRKARVNVQLPPRTGANLNLVNGLGEISAPKDLRVYRTPKEKFAKGQIGGGEQRVLVSIRAEDGSVVVK